jgi:serine/threonine protein kinase
LCNVYDFKNKHVLGAGSFGTVVKGKDKETNFEVAIKIIDKTKL